MSDSDEMLESIWELVVAIEAIGDAWESRDLADVVRGAVQTAATIAQMYPIPPKPLTAKQVRAMFQALDDAKAPKPAVKHWNEVMDGDLVPRFASNWPKR